MSRPKKRVPNFTAIPPIRDAQGVTDVPEVQYMRKDSTQIVVPVKSVPTKMHESKLQTPHSMALLWKVPFDERGNIVRLVGATLKIINSGAFDLYLNVLQPLGYESAPTAISGWFPVAVRDPYELKAGKSMTCHIEFLDNNFVVPLRTLVDGDDHLHVASMSFLRSALDVGGVTLEDGATDEDADPVAFEVLLDVTYVSSGSEVKSVKCFRARMFDNCRQMNSVDRPPMLSVAALSLKDETGVPIKNVTYSGSDTKDVASYGTFKDLRYVRIKFVGSGGGEVFPSTLNTGRSYRLNIAPICLVVPSRVVKGDKPGEQGGGTEIAVCNVIKYWDGGKIGSRYSGDSLEVAKGWYLYGCEYFYSPTKNKEECTGMALLSAKPSFSTTEYPNVLFDFRGRSSGSGYGNDKVRLPSDLTVTEIFGFEGPVYLKCTQKGHYGQLRGTFRLDGRLEGELGSFRDTLLSAISVITKVVKVAQVVIAAVAAVAESPSDAVEDFEHLSG